MSLARLTAAVVRALPRDAMEAIEERAAIMEFDGGLSREDAERKAIEAAMPELRGGHADAV